MDTYLVLQQALSC